MANAIMIKKTERKHILHVPHRCLPDSCVKKEIKKQKNKDIRGRWERRKGQKSKTKHRNRYESCFDRCSVIYSV